MIAVRDGSELLKRVSNVIARHTSDKDGGATNYCDPLQKLDISNYFFYSVWYRNKEKQFGCKIPPKFLDGGEMEMLPTNREAGSRLSCIRPSGLWFVSFLRYSLFRIYISIKASSLICVFDLTWHSNNVKRCDFSNMNLDLHLVVLHNSAFYKIQLDVPKTFSNCFFSYSTASKKPLPQLPDPQVPLSKA